MRTPPNTLPMSFSRPRSPSGGLRAARFAQIAWFSPPDFPRKRKRSRWNQDSLEQKTVIPGMPTVIPPGLTREQERAYIGNGLGGKAAGLGVTGPGLGVRTRRLGSDFLPPGLRCE